MSSGSSVNEKIETLKHIIIDHANAARASLIDAARHEAETWIQNEMASLDKETDAIIRDATERADEMNRRRLLAASRERASERLRLQNRLLSDAQRRFRDALVRLRERADYADILTSLAVAASREMPSGAPLEIRLAASDASIGERVAEAAASRTGAEISFGSEAAHISGGVCVMTADGRRIVSSDWQTIAEEASDKLAERLLQAF